MQPVGGIPTSPVGHIDDEDRQMEWNKEPHHLHPAGMHTHLFTACDLKCGMARKKGSRVIRFFRNRDSRIFRDITALEQWSSGS